MSRVQYDGKRLIPAPLVAVNKTYQTAGDGDKVGSLFNLTIAGTITAEKGSPDSTGTFHEAGGYPADETITDNARLKAVMTKQEAIRDLFSTDGLQLEFQSADGSSPMKCNPRVLDIQFAQGQWYQTSTYTITLEADIVFLENGPLGEDAYSEYISSADETWTIETDEENPESEDLRLTYRLTHSVSAQGKRFFNETGALEKEAWEQARDWVLPRLGFDQDIALCSGVLGLPDYYGGFNYARDKQLDERGGSFSVTETWILSSGNALESFTVNTVQNIADGCTQVTIDGQINGLENRTASATTFPHITSSDSKYDNANTKFNQVKSLLHNRAQSFSGASLNSDPIVKTTGRSPANGTLTYSYQFDNRPIRLITDTRSEAISMQDSWDVDVFAAVGVLGRTAGPVLQGINTHQPTVRSLNLELVFGCAFAGSGSATERFITNHPRQPGPVATDIQSVVDAAHPVLAGAINNAGATATTAFVSNQNETWDPIAGRYSYQVEWTYE